jgi:mannose-1-phosphate guanylyltransferase
VKAVILVGGLGTRLRPLTDRTPKPLLPIAGVPILEHQIRWMARAGVDEVVLAVGYRASDFDAFVAQLSVEGVAVTLSLEDEPLGTGRALLAASAMLSDPSRFLGFNGDLVSGASLSRLWQAHVGRDEPGITLHLREVGDPSAFGMAALDDADMVVQYIEKPGPERAPSILGNAGSYVIDREVLEASAPSGVFSLEYDVFSHLPAKRQLFGYREDSYWIDIGRLAPYIAANLDALHGVGPIASYRRDQADRPGVQVVNSYVSADAMVGQRASIRGSVVLPTAEIGEDAVVEGSVVAGVVPPDAVVRDQIVA